VLTLVSSSATNGQTAFVPTLGLGNLEPEAFEVWLEGLDDDLDDRLENRDPAFVIELLARKIILIITELTVENAGQNVAYARVLLKEVQEFLSAHLID
jgi:hypothetical protein